MDKDKNLKQFQQACSDLLIGFVEGKSPGERLEALERLKKAAEGKVEELEERMNNENYAYVILSNIKES